MIISPQDRTATATETPDDGPVTLLNSFTVAAERDDAFQALWRVTSAYFSAQPGFRSLRLHRSVTGDGAGRWVNVAEWESQGAYRAAHTTDEFRRLVTGPGWAEFPSSPRLYEVVATIG